MTLSSHDWNTRLSLQRAPITIFFFFIFSVLSFLAADSKDDAASGQLSKGGTPPSPSETRSSAPFFAMGHTYMNISEDQTQVISQLINASRNWKETPVIFTTPITYASQHPSTYPWLVSGAGSAKFDTDVLTKPDSGTPPREIGGIVAWSAFRNGTHNLSLAGYSTEAQAGANKLFVGTVTVKSESKLTIVHKVVFTNASLSNSFDLPIVLLQLQNPPNYNFALRLVKTTRRWFRFQIKREALKTDETFTVGYIVAPGLHIFSLGSVDLHFQSNPLRKHDAPAMARDCSLPLAFLTPHISKSENYTSCVSFASISTSSNELVGKCFRGDDTKSQVNQLQYNQMLITNRKSCIAFAEDEVIPSVVKPQLPLITSPQTVATVPSTLPSPILRQNTNAATLKPKADSKVIYLTSSQTAQRISPPSSKLPATSGDIKPVSCTCPPLSAANKATSPLAQVNAKYSPYLIISLIAVASVLLALLLVGILWYCFRYFLSTSAYAKNLSQVALRLICIHTEFLHLYDDRFLFVNSAELCYHEQPLLMSSRALLIEIQLHCAVDHTFGRDNTNSVEGRSDLLLNTAGNNQCWNHERLLRIPSFLPPSYRFKVRFYELYNIPTVFFV